MGLETYWRKRNFGRTPEPKGELAAAPDRLRFVIQKHAASHLHYDFRLEMEGVLRSWAVPKGPSLDPKSRRLAMETEDHPLDYGDFEGVIPEGEYGGGTVIVWDHGVWMPDGDPVEGYRRGKLEFTLKGEKLSGAWRLVRMAPRTAKEQTKPAWLLFKRNDAAARSGGDDDMGGRSVISGRSIDEVAAAQDRVWHSNRTSTKEKPRTANRKPGKISAMAAEKPPRTGKAAGDTKSKTSSKAAAVAKKVTKQVAEKATGAVAKTAELSPRDAEGAKAAPLPEEPRAQLATLASSAPEGDTWLHEIKLDGYRLLARIDRGKATLVTRNGNDWTDRFAPLARALAELPCRQAVLDGEAVVLDAAGVSSFQTLQNVLGTGRVDDVLFYAFDLTYLEGFDLRGCPLHTRKTLLKNLLAKPHSKTGGATSKVKYSEHVVGNGAAFHQQACRLGLEGIVSKLADAPYDETRSKTWLKVKCLQRQEFVIAGFTDPSGSRKGLGALLLGVNEAEGSKRRLVFAGKVGTGFNAQSLRELHAQLLPLERKQPPVANPPRGAEARGVHWVEPRLVAEVAFTEWTGDGFIRHPSFQGLRQDKDPADIVREKPQAVPAAEPAKTAQKSSVEPAKAQPKARATPAAAPTAKRTAPVGDPVVAGVRLSNPSRVLYPDAGITKLELARYYEQVAPLMVPYVKDRPLTLLRCPEGHTKSCFFQKHANKTVPDEIPRVLVKETDAVRKIYMMVDDLPAIIRLVQMGVLEIHVWGSRAEKLEQPDIIVFDLDPGEGIPWKNMIATAITLRERLAQLGLATYPRFTGGKGIHVVVPLVPRADWDEVKGFSLAIAEEFVRTAPKAFSAKLAKRGRENKIFIDYLRNTRNATAVASYSARAKPNAPVALPVRWEDIESSTGPMAISIRDVPAWLDKLGHDPWQGFSADRKPLTKAILKAVGFKP